MTEPLSIDWIPRLWRLWSTIRKSRRTELEEIENVFGSPELLASTYIEPDCQRINPADHDEDEPLRTFRQPIRGWLNGFLEGEFFERDGRNTLFVLSDAGMGKSSLLMMLKLSHMLQFWPDDLNFRLEKLGDQTLERISVVNRPSKTVLLLDALDEDPAAWGRIEERLSELLHATKGFRQVLLTCRTQFFPEGGQKPIESPEKVEVAGFVCNMLYLSPFNAKQVEAYLQKRYPNGIWARLSKQISGKDNPDLVRARELLEPMRSLRMRPMLLSHIDMLMDVPLPAATEYSVYSALIRCWLLREERRVSGGPTQEDLDRACEEVALHLQKGRLRHISASNLEALILSTPETEPIRQINVGGRSLLNRTSDGSYRFAHYSIQEFLVARRLVNEGAWDGKEPLRATDQILRFLFTWASEAPRDRLPRLPIKGLETADVQGLGKVGLEGQDLESIEFPRFLRGFDLSGCNLQGVKLAGADLRDADLRLANLRDADLEQADLQGADLRGANIEGCTLRDCKLQNIQVDPIQRHGILLVLVPGGEFVLGTEEKQQKVKLDPFWIGKYPVTNAQYGRFLQENLQATKPAFWGNKRFNDPQQPVVGVSWLEATAFAEWIGGSLPTEAQWEAAARGLDARRYPWGNEEPTPERADFEKNFDSDSPDPVGSHPLGASPFGIEDMAGTVWEWCLDEFGEDAYQDNGGTLAPVLRSHSSPVISVADRVLRGGSWADEGGYLPSALRYKFGAGDRFRDIGFRVLYGTVPEP